MYAVNQSALAGQPNTMPAMLAPTAAPQQPAASAPPPQMLQPLQVQYQPENPTGNNNSNAAILGLLQEISALQREHRAELQAVQDVVSKQQTELNKQCAEMVRMQCICLELQKVEVK